MPAISERIITDEQIEQFHNDGFLVVRGLFSPDETSKLREHFMAIHAAGPIEDSFHPMPLEETGGDILKHYPRIMQPHRWDELSRQMLLNAHVGSILRDLLGETPLAAQSMLYFKPPGARGQALHQDNFYLHVKPGTCLASWLALDDADEENGTLFAVPGSDKIGVLCPHPADMTKSFTTEEVDIPAGSQPVRIDLKAGDVLFFNGSVIHGSYPNVSRDRFRRAFICHYVGDSTTEMSSGYYPLLDFDGMELTRASAQGGGPCGTEELSALEEVRQSEREKGAAGVLQGAIAA